MLSFKLRKTGMRPVLVLLLTIGIGFALPACKKDEDKLSFSGDTFTLTIKKNEAKKFRLGIFDTDDKVEISKQPVHAAQSLVEYLNGVTYYSYTPQPDFTGPDEAQVKITSRGEATFFNFKIIVR